MWRQQKAENIRHIELRIGQTNESAEPGVLSIGTGSNRNELPPLRTLHAASLYIMESGFVYLGHNLQYEKIPLHFICFDRVVCRDSAVYPDDRQQVGVVT